MNSERKYFFEESFKKDSLSFITFGKREYFVEWLYNREGPLPHPALPIKLPTLTLVDRYCSSSKQLTSH